MKTVHFHLHQLWRAQGRIGQVGRDDDHSLLTTEGLKRILDAFQMVKHWWDQYLGIPNSPFVPYAPKIVKVHSMELEIRSISLLGCKDVQMCHEGSFPTITTRTLLLAVSLELRRKDFICCHSNQKKRPAALQKLSKTIWSTETIREKMFGRCKRAVILIRQKPLGDLYTASPSSISNASAYTRLASGTLWVWKKVQHWCAGGSWLPLVLFQQTAEMER